MLQRSHKTFVLLVNGNPTTVSIDRLKAHRTCEDEQCILANSSELDEQSRLDMVPEQRTRREVRRPPKFDDFIML